MHRYYWIKLRDIGYKVFDSSDRNLPIQEGIIHLIDTDNYKGEAVIEGKYYKNYQITKGCFNGKASEDDWLSIWNKG